MSWKEIKRWKQEEKINKVIEWLYEIIEDQTEFNGGYNTSGVNVIGTHVVVATYAEEGGGKGITINSFTKKEVVETFNAIVKQAIEEEEESGSCSIEEAKELGEGKLWNFLG